MDAALERRVNVATCWATTRIAVLDSTERYEDSYALTQEFREWITCLGEHPELLEDSVLSVQRTQGKRHRLELDEAQLLELVLDLLADRVLHLLDVLVEVVDSLVNRLDGLLEFFLDPHGIRQVDLEALVQSLLDSFQLALDLYSFFSMQCLASVCLMSSLTAAPTSTSEWSAPPVITNRTP